tara:strand:+ start:25999 stop:26217 length:219 start_codon:yes stop_codon:yes gene_type:complete
MDFKSFIKSKRFAMIIYVMIAWFIFGILAIIYRADLGGLSAYFASLSPFIIGYIYGETKRKSEICKCKKLPF